MKADVGMTCGAGSDPGDTSDGRSEKDLKPCLLPGFSVFHKENLFKISSPARGCKIGVSDLGTSAAWEGTEADGPVWGRGPFHPANSEKLLARKEV